MLANANGAFGCSRAVPERSINDQLINKVTKLRCVSGRNFTLILSGNKRLRHVERLNDQDVLALAQSLKNKTRVTGERTQLKPRKLN